MTEDQKHEFVADITIHLLECIEKGDQVFAILSFKHDEDRDTMRATLSTVKVGMDVEDDRMQDKVSAIVGQFMDEYHAKWAQ